jgi:hypothetical protein
MEKKAKESERRWKRLRRDRNERKREKKFSANMKECK